MPDETRNVEESEAAETEESSSTLATVEAKMEEIRGLTDGTEETEEAEDTGSGGDADTEDIGEANDDAPLLPSGHRRAALARGYTNEEIDHYIETDSDEALGRFGELFDDWQRQNSDWSERGRQLKAGQQQGVSEEQDTTDNAAAILSHYDPKVLIEEHGNDDLINALVTPLNAMVDRVNATTERLSQSEQFLQSTEQDALATTTQSFLMSDGMKAFRDTYGGEVNELTEAQVSSRMKLFEQADILASGARDHGMDITVTDALERAQIIVSQGTRDEAIRRGIRESMTKRTKTTKSSHRQTAISNENQSISDSELEKRTAVRLQKLRTE